MARSHSSRDLAWAGGILALVGLVAALAPGWAFLAVTLGIVALGLGCASLLLPGRARRAGAVVALVSAGVAALGVARLGSSAPDPTPDPGAIRESPAADASGDAVIGVEDASGDAVTGVEDASPIDPDATVVTYEIVTDGMSVTNLSYVDLVDGRPTMRDEMGVPPPFQHVVRVPSGSDLNLADLSVTGMGGATSRRTACVVTVDGETVARSTADGPYGLVTCAVPAS